MFVVWILARALRACPDWLGRARPLEHFQSRCRRRHARACRASRVTADYASRIFLRNCCTNGKCLQFHHFNGKNRELWQFCHNCRGRAPNKEQKKTLVKSVGWLAPPESLEFAAHDDLKKIKLAHLGRQREAILVDGVSRGACARFRTLRPGGFGPRSSGITTGPRGARYGRLQQRKLPRMSGNAARS